MNPKRCMHAVAIANFVSVNPNDRAGAIVLALGAGASDVTSVVVAGQRLYLCDIL